MSSTENRSVVFAFAVLLAPLLGFAQTTHTINQSGLSFSPADLTIQAGDTVQWVWGNGSHTVTNGTGSADPQAGTLFDAPFNASNQTVVYTFTTVGDVPYFCRPHFSAGMTGIVRVQPAPPTSVFFAGLEHTPLGGAQLAVDGLMGSLTVSNIGSSGLDGVSIDLGETAEGFGFVTSIDPTDPAGSSWDLRYRGTLGTGPEQDLFTFGHRRTAAGTEVHPDFAWMPTSTFTATLLDAAGQTVIQQSGLTGGEIVVMDPTATLRLDGQHAYLGGKVNGKYENNQIDIEASFPGAGIVSGRSLVFEPDAQPSEQIRMTVVDWVLVELNPFTIFGESIFVFGNPHLAIGQAHMEPRGNKLYVGNLDFAGNDGVQQVLPPGTQRDCLIWDIKDSNGSGALNVEVIGSVAGVVQPAGRATYTKAPGGYQVTAVYSAVGATSFTTRVFNGSSLVASYSNQTGILAEIPVLADAHEIVILVAAPSDTNGTGGFEDKFDTPVPMGVGPAKDLITGDRLVIIPENADSALEDLQGIVVLCNLDTEFEILNELVDAAPAAVGDLPPAGLIILDAPYPNPFNPRTEIRFELLQPGIVDLDVFDVRGQKVRSLLAGSARGATGHRVNWDGTSDAGSAVASGSYLFRLRSGDQNEVVKGVLVR